VLIKCQISINPKNVKNSVISITYHWCFTVKSETNKYNIFLNMCRNSECRVRPTHRLLASVGCVLRTGY